MLHALPLSKYFLESMPCSSVQTRFIGCGYKRAHNDLKLPPRKGYHIKLYYIHMAYSENHYLPLPPEEVPISGISGSGPWTACAFPRTALNYGYLLNGIGSECTY